MSGIISRGFQGRRVDTAIAHRVPPGQYLTNDFPVLSAGPTPHTPLDRWSLVVDGLVDQARTWSWDEFQTLPRERFTVDIHCVTRWSKLDTTWEGVSLDTLLAGRSPGARYLVAHCDGGYTTNLPIEDVLGGKAWIAFQYEGNSLAPEHGGPARLVVPHLYFWKSAKWIRRLELRADDKPGYWEDLGYHHYGDPWLAQRYEFAQWQPATLVRSKRETSRVTTLDLDVPGWTGHRPGQFLEVRLLAEDGHVAERNYSIASAPAIGGVQITVECLDDGEVSPFLTRQMHPGDVIEVQGPIGGGFTWTPHVPGPLVLIGGGSGIVPLMSMLRARATMDDPPPTRLLGSFRTWDQVIYRDEIERLAAGDTRLEVAWTLTRHQPAGWDGYARRIDPDMLAAAAGPASNEPNVYICGPTPFVERAAEALVGLGHDPARIHTERFGPTAG